VRIAALAILAVTLAAAAAVAVAIAPERQNEEPRAVLWAVGDGASGSAAAKRVAARIAADRPTRFLYLGDVYPHGTARDYARNYAPVYGRLARLTEPTPGNHEWGARRSGYFPYWRRVKGRPQPQWYRLSLAGWEILSLNSQAPHGARSSQLGFLRRALRGGGTCRIAFWHRPRFSAGRVHGDAPDVAPFWSALRGRARLVLTGHEHSMQRFKPRDGLTQYVSGAGGTGLYGLRRDGRLAFARSDAYGALRIVLRPGRATLEFRAADGRVLDRSDATCQRPG
jgi:acid phosphatase type 7